jgi:hypothetical protein
MCADRLGDERTYIGKVLSCPGSIALSEQKPTKVKRDRMPLLVFELVAFGIVVSLLFAHYG